MSYDCYFKDIRYYDTVVIELHHHKLTLNHSHVSSRKSKIGDDYSFSFESH